MSNVAEFDRIMKEMYRAKSVRLEKQNSELWDVALILLKAIYESEHTLSIGEVQAIGEQQSKVLTAILNVP